MTTVVDTRPPAMEDRERRLLELLQRVWTYAITTKSDYAREYADEIAQAGSLGFLTTQVSPGDTLLYIAGEDGFEGPVFGRLWKITPSGLNHLWSFGREIAAEEARKYEEDYVNAQR